MMPSMSTPKLWGLQLLFGWMNLVLVVPSIYLMFGLLQLAAVLASSQQLIGLMCAISLYIAGSAGLWFTLIPIFGVAGAFI